MATVLRIIDNMPLNDRDTVYTVRKNHPEVLSPGSIFYDLSGSRFIIKSVEMISRKADGAADLAYYDGLLLQPLDEKKLKGTVLLQNPANLTFLFCADLLSFRQPDPDYQLEYQQAGKHFCTALFSYEEMAEGRLKLSSSCLSGLIIYRGWMMKPAMYRRFYDLLENKGLFLINTPDQYNHYHLLPGWYGEFEKDTARSVWTASSSIDDVLNIAKPLKGPYIIKDYVKSRKHEWYEACFIDNIQNTAAFKTVAKNFVSRQGDDLVGGVVLREFLNLKKTGFHPQSGMPLSEEYRIFISGGRILSISGYWGNEAAIGLTDSENSWIQSIADKVVSNFITADLARLTDGRLVIMEFGDGQVSGLQQLPAESFYDAFAQTGQ